MQPNYNLSPILRQSQALRQQAVDKLNEKVGYKVWRLSNPNTRMKIILVFYLLILAYLIIKGSILLADYLAQLLGY